MYIDYIKIDWGKVEKESYLRGIPALKGLERLAFDNPFTFFVGENGSGKSTLLEAIAVHYGFNPEGGSLNYSFSTFDDHSNLYRALTVGKGVAGRRHGFFLRAESFFNVATSTLEYERLGNGPMFGKETLHAQSHGESFMSVITTMGKGLFLFDEPEAALSPNRQMSLLSKMMSMAEAGSQYIVVTHSPILLALPGATIYAFDDTGLHRQSYEQTDSYRYYELFINHRDRIVRQLSPSAG